MEKEIVLDGIIYVRKDTVTSKEFTGEIKIVVFQRGWMYIGRFERNGNDCLLHNSSYIRDCGTNNGLHELVNGPTSSTKLDKCDGVVEFNWLSVGHTITVNQSKWSI